MAEQDHIITLLELAGLIHRKSAGELTQEEQVRLNTWLAANAANRALLDELGRQELVDELLTIDPAAIRASAHRVYAALGMEPVRDEVSAWAMRRIGWRSWVSAAAAVILLATGAWLLWPVSEKPAPTVVRAAQKQDVPAPVGSRTTLTLADGKQIVLDSAGNGLLAVQGGSRVAKSENGILDYQVTAGVQPEIAFNTLTTARGGQTMVILPDGTKVWLNALSTLRYPTSFAGRTDRQIELTGEGYFEVAHIANRPFRVRTGKTIIEDIGTKFNINAYADEPVLRTTLLEGAVKVNEQKLIPGEQALVDAAGSLRLRRDIDPDEVLAWKSGLFAFNRTDMTEILRQISRWYAVEVVGTADHRTFSGIVKRSSNLSEVMKIFGRANIRFRIENNKIILIE